MYDSHELIYTKGITTCTPGDILYNRHRGIPINTYIVVDVETTMCSATNFSAEPFDPRNYVLQIGWCILEYDASDCSWATTCGVCAHTDIDTAITALNLRLEQEPCALVGHNIKFDMHHLAIAGLDLSLVRNAYDTQTQHYLQTGTMMPSLDEVSEYHGLGSKDDSVKKLIESGVLMQDIPASLVSTYLERDVYLTAQVFHKQMMSAGDQLKLFNIYARYTLALQAMEFNGLAIDKPALSEMHRDLTREQDKKYKRLERLVKDIFPAIVIPSLGKLTAPKILNQMLFSHECKYKHKTKVGKFKNGKDKFASELKTDYLPELINPEQIFDKKEIKARNKNTGFSMNEEVINRILDSWGTSLARTNPEVTEYLETVLELRKMDKLTSTYTNPIGDYLTRTCGDRLHPKYTQCNTATGRLASSNPNAQNFPPEIDKLVTCDEDEVIVKADFSQLEVVVAGMLSTDKQLLSDLNSGVDVHEATGKAAGFPTMTKTIRRDVKGVNFGTIYGGKPPTISKQTGIPPNTVKDIQDAFFSRYPDLKQYNADKYEGLKKLPVTETRTHPTTGLILKRVVQESITGRKYWYNEYPEYHWGTTKVKGQKFSFPQSCNYNVQGMATGDIVPGFIAIVHTLKMYDPAMPMLMQRTIHDSLETKWNLSDDTLSNINVEVRYIHNKSLDILTAMWKEWTGEELCAPLKLDFEIYNSDGEEV